MHCLDILALIPEVLYQFVVDFSKKFSTEKISKGGNEVLSGFLVGSPILDFFMLPSSCKQQITNFKHITRL